MKSDAGPITKARNEIESFLKSLGPKKTRMPTIEKLDEMDRMAEQSFQRNHYKLKMNSLDGTKTLSLNFPTGKFGWLPNINIGIAISIDLKPKYGAPLPAFF